MASRQERKLAGSGARLLNGNTLGIGVAIAVLGAIPVVVGIVLMLTAGTEQHSRKDRPFA
jgi:hypothetical protein